MTVDHYEIAKRADIDPYFREDGTPRYKTERDRCADHPEDFQTHPDQLILSRQPQHADRLEQA